MAAQMNSTSNATEKIELETTEINGDNLRASLDFFSYIYYAKMILVVIGVPGNILCICVMRQKTFKTMARGYISITLAFADLGLLVLDAGHMNFGQFTESSLSDVESSIAVCKYINFLLFFLLHIDSWMIVLLNVERLIAVFRPHKVKVLLSKKRVNIVIGMIVVFFIIWDGEEIIRKEVAEIFNNKTNETSYQCQNVFWKEIANEILATALPIAVMIPNNAAIVIKITQLARKRRQMSSISLRTESIKVPWMMLCVTTSFIVLLLPSSIYYLFIDSIFNSTLLGLTVLNTANAAINFYIYFLSGSLFRAEVKRLLCRCWVSSNPGVGSRKLSIEPPTISERVTNI